MESNWRQRRLGISGIVVVANEDPGHCPVCAEAMRVQKTFLHTAKTMQHGTFQVRETVHVCRAECRHPSGALVTRRARSITEHIITGTTIGYDTMVFIGLQRYIHHRQREEIRADLLQQHGIDLSSGQVSNLAKQFLQYLETLHWIHADRIREIFAKEGGYPLHVDATCEDGRGTMLVALAGWRRWVLDAWKIPTEHVEVILPALRSVVTRFGAPCALVRDLGKAMIPAIDALVRETDGKTRVLSCHQHFLADVGKDLLEPGHGELRNLFRRYKIRPNLGSLARDLGRKLGVDIAKARDEVLVWQTRLDEGHVVPAGRIGLASLRALTQWVLDYQADGNDQGFPFDRPYVFLYERCVTARRAVDAFLRTPPEDKQVRATLERLARILQPVLAEPSFRHVADRLRQRAKLFDALRDALRLLPKSGRRMTTPEAQSLHLKEAIEELHDIQAAVESFVTRLRERRPERGPAQDMRAAIDIILQHIETHGDTLWGHVVSLSTPEGEIIRIVDRTNNILERGLFGELKQGERRRSGRKNLTQDFEHLPAAVALTRNLTRPDYVELVCGTLDQLPEVFAALDAGRREKMSAGQSVPPLGRPFDPIPETATASLPRADRRLLRTEAMQRRVLAAANSRAPRSPVKRLGRLAATVE